MKYTFQFDKGDKQVLETRSTESQRHIILKILGYILFYDRSPRIELRVSEDKRDYRPDVVAFNSAGNISLWVDCGHIALRKADDLTRQQPTAEIVIIKATANEMEAYAREAVRKRVPGQHMLFLGFDSGFVPALVACMGHLNSVQWQWEDARLTVRFNAETISTNVWQWSAETGSLAAYSPLAKAGGFG